MQTGETADLDCGANADLDMSRTKRRLMNFLTTTALVISEKKKSFRDEFGRDNSDCCLKTMTSETFVSMKLCYKLS